jgi:nesprin-1
LFFFVILTRKFVSLQFDRLLQEAGGVKEKLDAAVSHKDFILGSLNKADQMEIQGNLQSLLDGYNRINAGIEERSRTLQSYVSQQREIAVKVEESIEFLNKIQEDVRALNKPIGFRPEDTQVMLNSYELLLAELRVYREKMEDLQHRTTGNSGDLASIVKQQDELIASIESQIKKLRHLLLLRQQFMALVAEITTFIAKYNEVVQDIEKGGKTAQEKIRRYEDVSFITPNLPSELNGNNIFRTGHLQNSRMRGTTGYCPRQRRANSC